MFRRPAGPRPLPAGGYIFDLEQRDLCLFNTRLIHEVPAVEGDLPHFVLATFIGYSPDDPEVYVWS